MEQEKLAALCEAAHEAADVTINWGGYADDEDESNRRGDSRDRLERAIMALCLGWEEVEPHGDEKEVD